MKRCPTCDASYDAHAAWCPVDGARLVDDGDDGDDAGRTLRDMPNPMTPGSLTMGWEIPDVPGIADAPQPRTTPTQLAAMGEAIVPTTLAGVPSPPPTTNRLKAATLPPAAPRMTPQSLATALAKAPAPRRLEPLSTPTSVNVPLPTETPPAFSAQRPIELPPDMPTDTPTTMTVPVDLDADTTDLPTHVQDDAGIPRQTRPMQTSGATPRLAPSLSQPPPFEPSPAETFPSVARLGPPPNLSPRPTSPSQPPPQRRASTQPMPVVVVDPPPLIEVLPTQASQSMQAQPQLELTAPVAQVSVELRAPITMPGVVAPEIRTSQPPLAVRKPPSPSDAPPMGVPQAVPSELNQPSAALRPAAPERSNRWMWIAIALIIIAGVVGTLVALQ